MFIPKWLLNYMREEQREHEKRIKRLELIMLNDAQQKISSLEQEKFNGSEVFCSLSKL